MWAVFAKVSGTWTFHSSQDSDATLGIVEDQIVREHGEGTFFAVQVPSGRIYGRLMEDRWWK